jgi:hypothetical protein
MKSIRGTVDVTQGVKLDIVARLSPADAQWVVTRAKAELEQQRNSTMVKLSGLSLLLDRIKLHADGERLTIALALSEAEMTRLQTPLAMLASVLVAGQLPPAPRKRPPPGQPIRRVEQKQK